LLALEKELGVPLVFVLEALDPTLQNIRRHSHVARVAVRIEARHEVEEIACDSHTERFVAGVRGGGIFNSLVQIVDRVDGLYADAEGD